ncbi:MAG: S8 family serine peptidase [Lysobacter sp.]
MTCLGFTRPRPRRFARAAATALSLILALPAVAGQAHLSGLNSDNRFDRFIVKYKDNAPEKRDANARNRGLTAAASTFGKSTGHALNLSQIRRMAIGFDVVASDRPLDKLEAAALIRGLAADPNIESVQVDAVMRTALLPNDPLYAYQWNFYQSGSGINVGQAWNASIGNGVVVAVIDTGILNHADLNANLVPGYDFVTRTSGTGASDDGDGRDPDPTDSSNLEHGTHVAGIVAAATNNGIGVSGIAFGAKVLPLRVVGRNGMGFTSDIADAIVWAAGGSVSGVPANPNPAKVINVSLGSPGTCEPAYQNAINAAVAYGATVVIAAGNDNIDVAGFNPASCANIVAVAANNLAGNRAYYSNYGAGIDVTAPGGETAITNGGVLSTVGKGNYAWYQGTSMAAPHVAGVAALILSRANKTPAEVEAILKSTAHPLPGSCSGGCGAGIVDAFKAMALVNAPRPTLHAVSKLGTVGRTEEHALDAANAFRSFLRNSVTALGVTGSDQRWSFDMGDYNHDGIGDLYVIDRMGASNFTELHVLNGADYYQTYLFHGVTALQTTGSDGSWQYRLGDYNNDGQLDLYTISRQNPSGYTEVHVLNAVNSFKTFLAHSQTVLFSTGTGGDWAFDVADYNHDGHPDIFAIGKQGGSGRTELHVLNGASNFQDYLTHIVTVLGNTGTDLRWVFEVADYNQDGVFDLYAINRMGSSVSNTTEVHVLDGRNSFQNYLINQPSALQTTGNDASWMFVTGQR